ncbi:MAG: Transcriptional regulator [Bacteroidetes bacterium]|jgi:DNA-binding IscR family transcriptional regulator|nr:Transcriptional regulator [Bacteroidota bacterium]
MGNTRFATAIHILTILALTPEKWLSSEWIAGSINTNPVIVRRELAGLQKKGYVVTSKGKDGGSKLAVPCGAVSLADIYLLVKNSDILGKKNLNPNPKCPVGKNINSKLNGLISETDNIIVEYLSRKTLEDFVNQFH